MFNLYPYTDFHELNLDMILRMMKDLHKEWTDFEAVNKITNAGAWDITKQYQAWTVVSDNNIGYISLKPVPAGVAITNTEYWGVIADYDILITDLSARISALESQVAKNTKIVSGKWIFLTDSYGTTAGNNAGDNTTILTELTSLTDVSDILYYAISGSGFIGDGLAPTFSQYLSSVIVPGIADPLEITRVYVCAGRNDISAENLISAAISSFVTNVKNTFPNATVYVGYIANGNNTSEGTKVDQINGYNAYKKSIQYGCKYLTGIENTLHDNALMYTDGVHPNAGGKKEIARAIYQTINGLNITYNRPFVYQSVTVDSNITVNSGSLNVGEYVCNDLLYPIITAGITFTNTVPVTAFGVTTIKMGDISNSDGYILAPYGAVTFNTSAVVLEYGGRTSHMENAYITINADGKIDLKFRSNTSYAASAIFLDVATCDPTPTIYC